MRIHMTCYLIVLTGLSACGEWHQTDQKTSPDGRAVATVEVQLRGASSSNTTRISVENGNGGTLISPREIVSADAAIVDATRVTWASPNDLRVILCAATAYRVRARLLRDPLTLQDGSENAVSVAVENWRYSEQEKRCVRS